MGRCQRPNLRPVPTSWYHDCEEQGSVTRAPDHSEVEVIDYNGFYKVRQELLKRGERFKQYFEPSHFLKFPRDPAGRIAIVPFFTFVVRRVNLSQTRVQLSYYDALGCGYLREKDPPRINFIFEMIPTMPQLNTLQEEFYPFYVFTADPKRTGRVRIRDLLSSPILPELYELRQEHPLGDAEHNWFSMQSALKVYDAYLFLDNDQNGMLSRNELARFGSGMLTDVFIDRPDSNGTIPLLRHRIQDYKTFLDFVLAMENKGTPQAVRYFWKLLDIHHTGCIDGFVINYFFRAIVKVLRQIKGSEIASVDDVKDEIFDMVRSKTTGIITLDDLLHCSQGGTVLSMLFDAAAFWLYDNRESLLMEQDGFLVKVPTSMSKDALPHVECVCIVGILLLVECGEVTEREEFSVPIRASGGSALLDFPDVIDFGDECIVGYQCERTVLVRNVGDRASKLLCRTTEPFSIDVPDGFLEEGASCQVSVFFTPSRAERYECDLQIKYGELEAVATLRGQARNAEVSLSHSLLLIEEPVTCACCFLPKDALVYCATAFLSAVGQEDVTMSVQLLNQGDIEFDFRLVHREGKFAPRFKFTPDHGTIAVGGQCEIVVDFKPKELGPFHEARSLGDREATSVWFFGWMFNRCCYVFYWTPSSASSS
eukprot:g20279.t1